MILYNGPIGEMVENPTEDFLKDIVFNKGEEYWKMGSGDSCIEIQKSDERLVFFYDEPYGFFIMRHPDYFVIYDKSIEIKTVEHRIGGEPMQIPTCSYVDREKAYAIISDYIYHRKVPEWVEWVDLYDIDFEYGF